MKPKQNFRVTIEYLDVDQLPKDVLEQFVRAEVDKLHANRPAIFGTVRFHECIELARSDEEVEAEWRNASPMERKP